MKSYISQIYIFYICIVLNYSMTLFNRKAKPLQPTSEARDILAKARAILNESNSILSLSKGWANQVSGFVSIGVIPTIAPLFNAKVFG